MRFKKKLRFTKKALPKTEVAPYEYKSPGCVVKTGAQGLKSRPYMKSILRRSLVTTFR